MNLRLDREINAPVAVVFSLLTDIETLALWLDGLQEATYTSSYNAQNPTKGTTFKRTFIENGETLEFEGEIITFNKPHHFAFQLKRTKIPVSVQIDYKLTPVQDGTRLNYEAQLVNANWLVRKIAATMNEASMKQQQAEQLDKLKAVAEQQYHHQQPAADDDTQAAETGLDTPRPDPKPPTLYRLTVHTPYKTWQVELHTQPQWTIGRGTDNDIVIDHQKVSRNHARIEQQENSFVVQDLGSTNGTWLNQQQIQCHTLQHMDTLTIGNAQLTFKDGSLAAV